MPDIFIPEDTTRYTSYYKEAVYTGLTIQFAFLFTDQNRQQLMKFNTVAETERWLKRQNILEKFARYAEEHGLRRRNLMLQRSAPLFERNLISNIIYNAQDQSARLQYLSEEDPAILRAIELFNAGESFPKAPEKSETETDQKVTALQQAAGTVRSAAGEARPAVQPTRLARLFI